jgi:hypothetical protein
MVEAKKSRKILPSLLQKVDEEDHRNSQFLVPPKKLSNL